ncbi:hypothetical protein BUALT_Bualt02G0092600 [Buddleja alternifolia]|uniref:NB-ARC domain-containing protein n=1 Tax=Buddleja alternifolia TaxID=168488 RepID=A0AAV6Y039_9LAMI|nr:hypothetical protein BUALT_Bualt02G0092600 [Buddleja alternifolia]
MDVQKVCWLQILPEREAWSLFIKKVGMQREAWSRLQIYVDDLHLVSIAEEVAKECKGLPITLVTLGRALKDKKSKSIRCTTTIEMFLPGLHLREGLSSTKKEANDAHLEGPEVAISSKMLAATYLTPATLSLQATPAEQDA